MHIILRFRLLRLSYISCLQIHVIESPTASLWGYFIDTELHCEVYEWIDRRQTKQIVKPVCKYHLI